MHNMHRPLERGQELAGHAVVLGAGGCWLQGRHQKSLETSLRPVEGFELELQSGE